MWLPLKNINIIKTALVKNKHRAGKFDYKLIFGHKNVKLSNNFSASSNFCEHWEVKKKQWFTLPNDLIRALNQENQLWHNWVFWSFKDLTNLAFFIYFCYISSIWHHISMLNYQFLKIQFLQDPDPLLFLKCY